MSRPILPGFIQSFVHVAPLKDELGGRRYFLRPLGVGDCLEDLEETDNLLGDTHVSPGWHHVGDLYAEPFAELVNQRFQAAQPVVPVEDIEHCFPDEVVD